MDVQAAVLGQIKNSRFQDLSKRGYDKQFYIQLFEMLKKTRIIDGVGLVNEAPLLLGMIGQRRRRQEFLASCHFVLLGTDTDKFKSRVFLFWAQSIKDRDADAAR